MAYEAILYNQEGKALGDARAIWDRGWVLNGFEQCTFELSSKAELSRLEDFEFGNYLVIADDELDVWGGYLDPNQAWSTKQKVTMQAYSAEKLFTWRCYTGEKTLTGAPGVIYRQIIEAMNSVLPHNATLLRPGEIYEGGKGRQEKISAKRLLDDVQRIAARSRNDWYVEPVIEGGLLHFEGHWYETRGDVKDFALEEGVNIESSDNAMELQGEIWNYVFAYGKGSTWADRETAIAYNQDSIDQYGLRMYPLSVNAEEQATVKNSAEAFVKANAWPRRVFNLKVGGKRVSEDAKSTLFKVLRIGDIVDLRMYSVGLRGVDTQVRVHGMVHRGKKNVMDLTVKEIV